MFSVDTVPQVVAPSTSAVTVANNLRIASITMAAYDYFITIPAEIRVYKSTSRRSLGFILFVLIRYSSILVMTLSNTGFFYHHFSPNGCSHYYIVAPVFKVFQVMISQAILGIRAYNIAHRNIRIGRTLLAAYFVVNVFQWFTDIHNRIPTQTRGNCVPGNLHPDDPIAPWTFYFASMLFDLLTLSISTFYLLKVKAPSASVSSKMAKILLYDGLGYFVALTAVNMMNIILYRGAAKAIQSSGVSLAYAFTWIMSQRILIHLREARVEPASVIVGSQLLGTNVSATTGLSGIRYDEEGKPDDHKLDTVQTAEFRSGFDHPSEFDIEVRIDRSLFVDDTNPQDVTAQPITPLQAHLHKPLPRSPWDPERDHHF
ncbi:hypothetical protein F5148DRAFT_392447 [Russula earlei]|uniref:Uncharacterized protein n=1 Tax=Russula earlei TaxID=71964 RepID=A0ACC0U012_9AGAM|nr:hypothetical protein F5148DRAFT_392447 [Russula earlei]